MAFVEQELGLKYFDFPALPGGAKAINEGNELAIACVSVPCGLHRVKKIVIINHQDCGAYGGSARFNYKKKKEQEFHESKLKEAKSMILDIYPEKEVILVYAKLVNNDKNIEFFVIK